MIQYIVTIMLSFKNILICSPVTKRFNHTNKIKIIESNGKVNDFELKSKNDVAKDIVEFLISHLLEK